MAPQAKRLTVTIPLDTLKIMAEQANKAGQPLASWIGHLATQAALEDGVRVEIDEESRERLIRVARGSYLSVSAWISMVVMEAVENGERTLLKKEVEARRIARLTAAEERRAQAEERRALAESRLKWKEEGRQSAIPDPFSPGEHYAMRIDACCSLARARLNAFRNKNHADPYIRLDSDFHPLASFCIPETKTEGYRLGLSSREYKLAGYHFDPRRHGVIASPEESAEIWRLAREFCSAKPEMAFYLESADSLLAALDAIDPEELVAFESETVSQAEDKGLR